MTHFMFLSWKQQKRLFALSSSWVCYHHLIIRGVLYLKLQNSFLLRSIYAISTFSNQQFNAPWEIKKNHATKTRFSKKKKTNDDLIKTRSRYKSADWFVTLSFDEIKPKDNVNLVKRKELHWLYWFKRHWHKCLELWKERRFHCTCTLSGLFLKRFAQIKSYSL